MRGGGLRTGRGGRADGTADFADSSPGNLRADYVLPDRHTPIKSSFVFWPRSTDPLFGLVGVFDPALLPNGDGFPSSDHRLVAVDAEVGH
jgi:3-phytase